MMIAEELQTETFECSAICPLDLMMVDGYRPKRPA
jgi:hypothetical protein